MNNAHKCPRCKNFILDTYCCTCKEDINNMLERFGDLCGLDDIINPFGNIFGDEK